MSARLASSLLVGALMRRIGSEGGYCAILAKGDDTAGAILLVCCERGRIQLVIEQLLAPDGGYSWAEVGPKLPREEADVNAYLERRRRSDPDIWLVELDIPGVQRFAAEMIDEG